MVASTNWQKARAKTRQPYQPKLVVLEGTPCHFCAHPRSSHSSIVLQASCKVDQCECPWFDPLCGCGHLLSQHTWGTPPNPWECAFCPCKRFGADMTGTRERKEMSLVYAALASKPSTPKPAPEIHSYTGPLGAVYRWGRRELALFDCTHPKCPEQATYWVTRAWRTPSDKLSTVKATFCGPHFRQWAEEYMPPSQLTLF